MAMDAQNQGKLSYYIKVKKSIGKRTEINASIDYKPIIPLPSMLYISAGLDIYLRDSFLKPGEGGVDKMKTAKQREICNRRSYKSAGSALHNA